MRKSGACSLVFAVSILSGCGDTSADTAVPGTDARITEVTEHLTAAAGDGASGVVRITHGDKLLLESAFGSASCGEQEEVTREHVFMIGSITKEFTRVLGFVLEEKGLISFTDTVAEALPGFEGPIGQVTAQQLMDHTGGLPDIIDMNGRPIAYTVEYDYEPVSRDELVARAKLAELITRPGQAEQYSNLGYQLLAAIYEVATGESYPKLLRRYVFGPAGIKGAGFWFPDADERPFADGCRPDDEHWGNPIDDEMWGESGPSWNLMGAGGLLSTAESLGRFFEGIAGGVYFDNPEQLEKYKSSRMTYSRTRKQRVMGPAGSNGIFNAVAFWADADRFNVILMTNRADHPAEGELIRGVLRAFPAESFDARDGS